jgi:NitT/TauT family transport system substrate-binding protein
MLSLYMPTMNNILNVADYANLVSAVLVSSDKYISENPDGTAAFVAAFIHGLNDVIDDPDGAYEISLKYVEGLEENTQMQRGVLNASLKIWVTEDPGRFTTESWELAQSVMFEADLIGKILPVDGYFTNEFIP